VEILETIQFLEQSHQLVEVADLLVTQVSQLVPVVVEVVVVTVEVVLLGQALLEHHFKVIVVALLLTLDKIIQHLVAAAQVQLELQILLIYKVVQAVQVWFQLSQAQ